MTGLNGVFFNLLDTIVELHNCDRYFNQCGALRSAEVRFLEAIGKKPEITTKELAANLGLSTPAVSKQVQNLVEKEYVDRSINQKNRREIYLSLTILGNDLYKRNNGCKQRLLKAVQRDLSHYDSKVYLEIMEVLDKRIRKHLESMVAGI